MNNQLLVFAIDEKQYALNLKNVERTTRIVEITPLPKAPDIVLGVVNVQGKIIQVIDLRKVLGLPDKEISLSDQLIIAKTNKQTLALLVNSVSGMIERKEDEVISEDKIFPGSDQSKSIVKLEDGNMLILIHDLDKFISSEFDNSEIIRNLHPEESFSRLKNIERKIEIT